MTLFVPIMGSGDTEPVPQRKVRIQEPSKEEKASTGAEKTSHEEKDRGDFLPDEPDDAEASSSRKGETFLILLAYYPGRAQSQTCPLRCDMSNLLPVPHLAGTC